MWIEGLAEFEGGLRMMLGFEQGRPDCWVNLAGHPIPLAFNPYIGPALIYFYAPPAYLWFKGVTTDPYFYRYPVILIFVANSWLIFYLLQNFYSRSSSFYGAVAFLTSPLALLGSLVEHGNIHVTYFLVLIMALFFSYYVRGRGNAFLYLSGLTLGTIVLTRIEAFVWFIFPFSIYLALARPPLIMNRWKETKRKWRVSVLAIAAFCTGAGPMIAYNVVCPGNDILSFLSSRVLPNSIYVGPSPLRLVMIRIDEFWSFNLLNIWPMWELDVPNYTFAVLWVLCAVILTARWIVAGKPSLLLIITLTSIPLSILTTGGPRNEHLLTIQPVALLVVVSGLAFLAEHHSCARLAIIGFAVLIVGNTAVSALDWRHWNNLAPNQQTMLNQSDPKLLGQYLLEHHARDRILFTNVGLPQYVQYITVGRVKGEDIMDWTGPAGFANAVRAVLLDGRQRRVFVAVTREHDGVSGSVSRTKLLYSILDEHNIPYEATRLSSERNIYLYDIVVIEQGVAPVDGIQISREFLVSDIVDVRVAAKPNEENLIIGSIHGTGFKPGDLVVVNRESVFPTAFGSETWLTFAVPLETIGQDESFTIEVFRPQTLERSPAQVVVVKR